MSNEGGVFRNLLLLDIIVFGESSVWFSLICERISYLENITVSLHVSVL